MFNTVWKPYLLKDIKQLEQLQHRTTKYILNDYTSNYKSRLLELKILPLMYVLDICDIKLKTTLKPLQMHLISLTIILLNLIKNSQAVKKGAAPIKAMVKKDVKSKVAAKKWL